MARQEEIWEARKAAAKSILQGFVDEHTRESKRGKVATIYMDGCRPHPDIHPAIQIVEEAHLEGCKQDALFHQGQAQKYMQAIEAIEALTRKEQN